MVWLLEGWECIFLLLFYVKGGKKVFDMPFLSPSHLFIKVSSPF